MKIILSILVITSLVVTPTFAICKLESEIPSTTPTVQFKDNGDGTVSDLKTGLMWAKCQAGMSGATCGTGSPTVRNWQDTLDHAASSQLAGYSDWRVPNVKELQTTVEYRCGSQSINEAVFPGFKHILLWTSTPNHNDDEYAWTVSFSGGRTGEHARFISEAVRLVR